MKRINLFLFAMLLPLFAFAQDAQPDPTADFFGQILNLIKSFGGLPWVAKVAAIVMIIVASMKVSFIAPLWAKLGNAQVFVAPALGLIGGILSLGPAGITWQSAIAYIGAGAGAVLFHELLDAVKAIPGIGSIYVTIINLIESLPIVGSGGKAA